MTLVRIMPVSPAANESVYFSNVTNIGLDETSNKRVHNYITIFVDLMKSKVLFAIEGKDASTIKSFKSILKKHSGTVSAIKNISCDMSLAFISGAKENFSNTHITFDKFHVIKEFMKKLIWSDAKHQKRMIY